MPEPVIAINELRAFLAIAAEGSFLRAGRKLGISQATVSLRIKRLEEGLRIRLFKRGNRAEETQPTPAGHEMLLDAEALVAMHDRIVRRARARNGRYW